MCQMLFVGKGPAWMCRPYRTRGQWGIKTLWRMYTRGVYGSYLILSYVSDDDGEFLAESGTWEMMRVALSCNECAVITSTGQVLMDKC
jgi:hypothetical protein